MLKNNEKIRIILSGACGKMGRVIASLSRERGDCEIIAGVDISGEAYAEFPVYKHINDIFDAEKSGAKTEADVVIDYSHPSALYGVLNYCKMNGTPAVIATTGYSDADIGEIKKASEQIPVFFTFNMSLGVNLLSELVKQAAKVLLDFDVEIVEKHHNLKKDAPSGTALMLAEAVNDGLSQAGQPARQYVYDRHNVRRTRGENEIGLHSVRGGTIVGEHDVIFAGHDEVITLSHSAASKEIFAAGSIRAAIFLTNCPKGLYNKVQ